MVYDHDLQRHKEITVQDDLSAVSTHWVYPLIKELTKNNRNTHFHVLDKKTDFSRVIDGGFEDWSKKDFDSLLARKNGERHGNEDEISFLRTKTASLEQRLLELQKQQ